MHRRRHLRLRAGYLARAAGVAALASVAASRDIGAQQVSECPPPAAAPLMLAEDLTARLALAADPCAQDAAVPRTVARRLDWRFIPPSARALWTAGVADARGMGATAPSAGADVTLRAGIEGTRGPWAFRLAPELIANQNRDPSVTLLPGGDPMRSPFASPFYHGDFSADLPERRGDAGALRIAPGESGLWLTLGTHRVSLVSGEPTWGPLAGEGLVLGRSAAGLPRAELDLRFGADRRFALRWFGGLARESAWFDADDSNDRRVLSGLRAEYSVDAHGASHRAGLSRTVMGVGGGAIGEGLAGAFRAGDGAMDLLGADFELVNEASGTAAWTEVARQAPLLGVREFLRMPTKGIALRLGLSQRLIATPGATWTASAEFARLDQSGQRTDETPRDFYSSATVVQGWTHDGRPLGSGLGPGGQRQFARLDRAGRVWHLSAFAERVRWNDDALYREAASASDRHDVTLQAGIVVAREIGGRELTAMLSAGERLNHHLRGGSVSPGGHPVDVGLLRLGLTITPAATGERIVGVPPGT